MIRKMQSKRNSMTMYVSTQHALKCWPPPSPLLHGSVWLLFPKLESHLHGYHFLNDNEIAIHAVGLYRIWRFKMQALAIRDCDAWKSVDSNCRRLCWKIRTFFFSRHEYTAEYFYIHTVLTDKNISTIKNQIGNMFTPYS